MAWRPFSFEIIRLMTLDDRVGGDSGIIYSTSPHKAIGEDGETYFIKGPEKEIVFAELAGCILANAAGINVPCVRACVFDDLIYAGSREVSSLRLVAPWLKGSHAASNLYEIFAAIVVDIWLGNVDRNMCNIVGDQLPRGGVELVFIDFEKSVTLRPNPLIQSPMINPRELWPRNELREYLIDCKPLHPPVGTVQRIQQFDTDVCSTLIHPVVQALGGVEWAESSVLALEHRARTIADRSTEVWRQ